MILTAYRVISTRLSQLMFFEGKHMNTVQVVPTTGVEPVPHCWD